MGLFLSPEITLFGIIGAVLFSGLVFLPFFFSGLFSWIFLYKFRYDRLILAINGVEYHTFGITVSAKWSDVKRIKSEGLIGAVNGICVTPVEIRRRFKFFSKKAASENIQMEIFIPLSMFDINWRDAELGRQIKQYASHLFQ